MSRTPLPKLLRQVRKAISKEDYQHAEKLYIEILEFPEMSDDLDIKLRYAYCAEKNGNLNQALDYYSQVLDTYRQTDEQGAATSLEHIIEDLRKGHEQSFPAPEEAVQSLDDATLMQYLCNMGKLITLAPGDTLCRLGDMSDMLWLLSSGSLTVHLPEYDEPDEIRVREGHLTLVGEIGFFTSQRRLADVKATTTAELFAVNAIDIYKMQERKPEFKAAMERLFLERWAEPVLRRHTVFENIHDIDRMRIMKTFKRITLGPGETLIQGGQEHNYAYMIQSGCLFFMRDEDSPDASGGMEEDTLISSISPGEIIHLGGLFKGYKSNYRVVTATPVQLLRLSQEDFEPFTYQRPWIIQAILRFSQRPVNLQIMRPDDEYLWKTDRHVKNGTSL